jgi:hypothetical protein
MNRFHVVLAAAVSAALLVTFGGGACDRRADRARGEAKPESTTFITSAEVEAGRAMLEANADFERQRVGYQQRGQAELASISRRIEDLETRARSGDATTKAQLGEALSDIRLDRDVYAAALEAVDRATPATWTERKEAADRAWRELDNAVLRATRALPVEPYFDPTTPPFPPKTPMP